MQLSSAAANFIRRTNVSFSKRKYFEMRLSEVVSACESFAPISYAEKWDNVGLLIEPSSGLNIKKILLTNDLTETVLNEGIENKVNMIISYHPPIFSVFKRLTMSSWKERIIIQCLENRIAVYSPHTAWDHCPNGVNCWLAKSLPASVISPIVPSQINPNFGAGRIAKVNGTLNLRESIDIVKRYTGLSDVRVAVSVSGSMESPITRYAVCGGSGGSVLKEVSSPIDLYITGELSHHECLEAIHRNINVITLNHSNSERGFLPVFRSILMNILCNDIEITISSQDVDPYKTY